MKFLATAVGRISIVRSVSIKGLIGILMVSKLAFSINYRIFAPENSISPSIKSSNDNPLNGDDSFITLWVKKALFLLL